MLRPSTVSAIVGVRSRSVRVAFSEAQRAVTPGQSVVFYKKGPFDKTRGREVLGGGVIRG
ncbi:MAG: hypothetical protein HYW90_03460 [Candidatus Sungbacteria bacterium]|nr:hypothetical protein [Candidatus Sungbacteria bacterium]